MRTQSVLIKIVARVVGLAGVAAVVSLGCGLGCGSSSATPFCGDGVHDPGEQCDDGNEVDADDCSNRCIANLPNQLTVKWTFNKGDASVFGTDSCTTSGLDADSCTDTRVSRVQVEMLGPVSATLDESCGFRQVVFQDLPPGTYVARVSPLATNGDLRTTAVVEQTIEVTSASSQSAEVLVPADAWTDVLTGSMIFRINWAGADCADASPEVIQQRLTLESGGNVVDLQTLEGDMVNGSNAGDCRSFASATPQTVLNAPFGSATLRIEGLDAAGRPQFEQTFSTFIGAGQINCELHFDVDSLNPDPVDAGAPTDAGSGAMFDAGM